MIGSGWTWNILTIGRSGWILGFFGARCPSFWREPGRSERKRANARLRWPKSKIRMSKSKTQPTSVVTGAAGFLGSHLTDLLLARGHKVIGIDNFVTGAVDNIAHLGGNSNFRFIQQDVTEFIFLHGPVDYVWHFASPASPIDYLELPIQTLKVGSLGTHTALGLAKNKKA